MNRSRDYVKTLRQLFDSRPDMPQAPIYKQFEAMAREFGPMDQEASVKLARKHSCTVKECFTNCARIALADPDLTYYEGFGLGFIVTEHAWLVTPDGRVLDPTWALKPDANGTDYYGIAVPVKYLLRKENWYEPGWLPVVKTALKRKENK